MNKLVYSIASVAALVGLTAPALAGNLVNVAGASGIALDGYDPVAFFTDNKAINGDPEISTTYDGAKYLFASKDHKAKFDTEPEKYLPQYGGYCAFGAALGALFPVDIDTWQIRNGSSTSTLILRFLSSSIKTLKATSPRPRRTGWTW